MIDLKYAEMLRNAVSNADLSLAQISRRLKQHGFNTDKAYLSRLQNGKIAPASDVLNEALAEVLNIDPVELKAAAYREKIPADVLEKLQAHPKATSA
ncbi:helix-turn-helix domain-containing protein [Brevibacillus agri]|uniref:helix-turn-helix domain-containing protein n=1 Tax=Brevibacillus agri TaxID=51101 RepID=UPI0035BE87E7